MPSKGSEDSNKAGPTAGVISVRDDDPIDSELELEARKWYHRRSMAWAAFKINAFLLLCVLVLAVVTDDMADKMQKVVDFLVWAFLANASITGAYMGLSTWAEISKK